MLPKTLCRLGKPGKRRQTLLLPLPPSTWTLLLVSWPVYIYLFVHIYIYIHRYHA